MYKIYRIDPNDNRKFQDVIPCQFLSADDDDFILLSTEQKFQQLQK